MYDSTKPYKEQVIALTEKTWKNKYLSVRKGIYATFKKRFLYSFLHWLIGVREVDHTDGEGTKGEYHWKQRTFYNDVLDVLGMNFNDMLLARAKPYKLQDHIVLPEDDPQAIIEIMQAMSEECSKRKIVITGGETSIHNNIKGMEISMTVSGFIIPKFPYFFRKPKPNKFKLGDVLVGLRSNGLHSNGFTKVREVFGEEFRPEFVEPTKIYLDDIIKLERKYDIHGMMHITGGAFTKLKGVLTESLDVIIHKNHSLEPQPIFDELYKRGVSDEEMYKTFNCGIGFVLGVSKRDAKKIVSKLDYADVIGEVKQGSGKIIIDSMFSNKQIEY